MDEKTGLPIHSLYGETLRPTPEMLEGVDVLLFDIQDVGARYYTYPSTMASPWGGRPGRHPLRGAGPTQPHPGRRGPGQRPGHRLQHFVGLYPVPMRHGMTMGELARMIVGAFGIHVELHVVPMEGVAPGHDLRPDRAALDRSVAQHPLAGERAGLPRDMPLRRHALSVGRGTDRAFQWVGAPWLDGQALADTLNGYGLAGVRFEPATFTPHGAGDGKFDDTEVHGVRLVDSPTLRRAPGRRGHARGGPPHVRRPLDLERGPLRPPRRHRRPAPGWPGEGMAELTAGWDAELAAFQALRAPYLLYR